MRSPRLGTSQATTRALPARARPVRRARPAHGSRVPAPAVGVAALLLAGTLGAGLGPLPAAAASPSEGPAGSVAGPAPRTGPARRIDYHAWTTSADFARGRRHGTRTARGMLRLDHPSASGRYHDPHGYPTQRYDVGHWVSPWTDPGFALTELVASWHAATPHDTWVSVQVRGRDAAGHRSSWDTLGRWAAGDRHFHRTTAGAQRDDLARVAVDTWRANHDTGLVRWQLRLGLHRRTGTTASPRVLSVGAMSSRLPTTSAVRTSRPGAHHGAALGRVLPVPRFSQMVHRGEYPRYGGGGEAWCSPTSTSMVLAYDESLPAPASYRWVDDSYPAPWVDQAARRTYDYSYDGTGNWPFNTAYAAPLAGRAFVTRLRSLRQAELFVARGIPLVASISFGRGELDGAPISSTDGHLVVIVGFTTGGDVVVNDPAARHHRGVRRTYDRGQFENAWLPGSGGLTYVIHTRGQRLPHRGPRASW